MADHPFRINEEYILDNTKALRFHEHHEQPRQVQPGHMDKQRPVQRRTSFPTIELSVIVLLGIVLQIIVGLGSYSGRGRSPMHGDYEAQRHWMEITHHLPIKEWYRNSSNNNLQYWGLDYPPLTAYHSKIMGWLAHHINPSWMALEDSHGIETESHKLFMRMTAIISHLIIYTPGVLLWLSTRQTAITVHPMNEAVVIILFPGLISVDHGHFQYNSVSLGFFLISVYFLVLRRTIIASVFFVLALNYKQMELYHSLPIFVYILAVSLKLYYHETDKTIIVDFLISAASLWKVAFTTVCTFLVMWTPLAFYGDENSAFDAIKRIFPFERGLFE
ncbi:algn-6, partial [Pristionchus pacificus]|uniref:Alpha-1,3-glucosyltransferase n=1 Tax=Pristionchus pacificus TaxID=54126 RepID=A0A2A6D3M7_PRIPA